MCQLAKARGGCRYEHRIKGVEEIGGEGGRGGEGKREVGEVSMRT